MDDQTPNARLKAERERLGQLLLNTVGARMFNLGLHLAGTKSLLSPESAAAPRVQHAIYQLDQAQHELRLVVVGFAGPVTRSSSVVLVEQVSNAASLLGFTPKLQLSGSVDQLPAGQRSRLLAVVKEVLLIVAGQADVTWVSLDVAAFDGSFTLDFEDDGSFVEAPSEQAARALAARARLGGHFSLTPRSPSGTRLRWYMPPRS
jgi:signal transduction histidine kinase